jgi:hypothetical protein
MDVLMGDGDVDDPDSPSGMAGIEPPSGMPGALDDEFGPSEAYAMAVSLTTELEVGLEAQFRELILSLNETRAAEGPCEGSTSLRAGRVHLHRGSTDGDGDLIPRPVEAPVSPFPSRSPSAAAGGSGHRIGSGGAGPSDAGLLTPPSRTMWVDPSSSSETYDGTSLARQLGFSSPWAASAPQPARRRLESIRCAPDCSHTASPRAEGRPDPAPPIDLARLSRIQLRIRQRLRMRDRRLHSHHHHLHLSSSPRDETSTSSRVRASSLGVIRGAQVRFRTRKHVDSRRRAALAIGLFYRKRQHGAWQLAHELLGAPQEAGVHSDRQTAERPHAPSPPHAPPPHAPTPPHARQLRLSAVRLIERAYSEWKYHAEQARLAAEGDTDGGRDADLHSYHAERRACAARCIQQYLMRQQLLQQQDNPQAGGEGDAGAAGAGEGHTPARIEVIRRLQRNFRAQLSKQAEAAHELHYTSLREASCATGTGPQHSHLCQILLRVYRERKQRAAAAGGAAHTSAQPCVLQGVCAPRAILPPAAVWSTRSC